MSRIQVQHTSKGFIFFLALTMVLCGFGAASAQGGAKWNKYQKDFKKLYSNSEQAALKELAKSRVELREVVVAEAGVKDLCTSCHLGIDNPLLADAPEPFRTHPGKLLEQHPVNAFGCTLCHKGHGEGTTVEAAHGTPGDGLVPTKYIQSTCAGCHETSFMLEGAEKLERGRQLFSSNSCYACHAARGFEEYPKVAEPLDHIGGELSNPAWLSASLRDPAKLQPRTGMPSFGLSDKEVGDLTAYLFSLKGDVPSETVSLQGASAEQGERLFVERGCRGCHNTARDESNVSPQTVDLSSIGLKVTPAWVMEWLEDPTIENPASRMPKVDLTEEERRDLTSYLMTLKSSADVLKAEEGLDLATFDPENGKELLRTYGCHGCHSSPEFAQEPLPGADVAEMAYKPLEELSFGEAKVARTKSDWVANKIASPRIYETGDAPSRSPIFAFDEDEVEALTTYYLNNAWAELPAKFRVYASNRTRNLQQGEWIVTAYNCRGCHVLEEGGEARIAEHIELKSMQPPDLIGEGARVQPQWFCEFIREPTVLRPWLKMRMPRFSLGHEDHETLARYFALLATDTESTFPYVVAQTKDTVTQEEFDMGKYRVTADKCIQCHPTTYEGAPPGDLSLEDLSIDLMLTKKRLRFDWLKDFLRDPDKYVGADTKMPFVYYDPDGRPKMSDADMWIDLSAKFLMVMEELPEAGEESLEEVRPGSGKDWTSEEE